MTECTQRVLYRNSIEDPNCAAELSVRLADEFQRRTIVICVGTDRSTGDCLGPLIGTRLRYLNLPRTTVFGTLDEPVHAQNLQALAEQLTLRQPRVTVLAIDACLGKSNQIGFVTLRKGPLEPGTGVQKSLPAIGDLNLTGIVNVGGFLEFFVLQNTRLSFVVRIADVITEAVANALLVHASQTQRVKCSTWNISVDVDCQATSASPERRRSALNR